MTSKIDWSDVGNGGSQQGDGDSKLRDLLFIRFNSGDSHNIRPLGSAIKFLKAGISQDGNYRSAIIEDPDSPTIKKYSNMNISTRYAVNVIDRSDGRVKIMEGPISIFKELGAYNKHTGRNPGAAEGADFSIGVSGNGKQRRYNTSFTKNTTLTDEERKMIQEQGLYKLEKIFKVVEDDQIEEKLFGDSSSSNNNNKKMSSDTVKDELGLDGVAAGSATAEDDLDLNF